MDLLELDPLPDDVGPDPVLVVAFDGWTDAGQGGTIAAATLREAFEPVEVGRFPSDALYDYRDRRPSLEIDGGQLGELTWPSTVVELLTPPSGPTLVLVGGGEPDFAWQTIADDLLELCQRLGIRRYVGLGSVPGPIPHTRPVHLIATSSQPELLERIGRPHEQVVVPASCQVAVESSLTDAGLETLGLWVRIPHYIAGTYPEASRTLLEQLSSHLGTPVDLSELDEEVAANRERLDVAAQGSQEVREHVVQLEHIYDAEVEAERLSGGPDGSGGVGGATLGDGQVPSGDDLAAEIERFLQGRRD